MALENSFANNIAVVLLAAGGSSRLGTPKQMLKYTGRTLLQHSIHAAKGSGAHPIVVVLGANAEIIKNEIENDNAHVAVNAEWQEGIASSIRFGINTVLRINTVAEGVVLTLCDQPYVTSTLLSNLMMTYRETGKPIVACNYANTFGPPVFFHKTIFPELLQLRGDTGAKGVISKHSADAELLSFPDGSVDIDTEADYKKLSKEKRES